MSKKGFWENVPCDKCASKTIFGQNMPGQTDKIVPLVVAENLCDKCKNRINVIQGIVKDLHTNFNSDHAIKFKILEDKKFVSFKTGPDGSIIIKFMLN